MNSYIAFCVVIKFQNLSNALTFLNLAIPLSENTVCACEHMHFLAAVVTSPHLFFLFIVPESVLLGCPSQWLWMVQSPSMSHPSLVLHAVFCSLLVFLTLLLTCPFSSKQFPSVLSGSFNLFSHGLKTFQLNFFLVLPPTYCARIICFQSNSQWLAS